MDNAIDEYELAAQVQNAIVLKCQTTGFDSLVYVEKVIECASSLNFEVTMSDFYTYYYNSSGNHSQEAVWALHQLGAFEAEALVKQANAIFKTGTPPKDRAVRIAELRALGRHAEAQLATITSEFYAKVDLDPYIRHFILDHLQDFRDLDLSHADKLVQAGGRTRSELLYADIRNRIRKGMHISDLQQMLEKDVPITGMTTRVADTMLFFMPLKDVTVRLTTDAAEKLISWELQPL